MTHIGVYDDTGALLDTICDRLDITEPELIDMLIEAAEPDPEIGPAITACVREILGRK